MKTITDIAVDDISLHEHDDMHFIGGYSGGGYDGCFWEPNFCLVNSNIPEMVTKFTVIFATGCSGFHNADDFRDNDFENNEVLFYNLKDDTIDALQSHYTCHLVIGINDWLCENQHDDCLDITCDDCGMSIDEPYFGNLTHGHGNGGIGMVYDYIKCDFCLDYDAWKYSKDDFKEIIEDEYSIDSDFETTSAQNSFCNAIDKSGLEHVLDNSNDLLDDLFWEVFRDFEELDFEHCGDGKQLVVNSWSKHRKSDDLVYQEVVESMFKLWCQDNINIGQLELEGI